jgi:hypothetical protein
MAYSKNPLPKRLTIFEEQKNNRQKAIEILKQLKQKENEKTILHLDRRKPTL